MYRQAVLYYLLVSSSLMFPGKMNGQISDSIDISALLNEVRDYSRDRDFEKANRAATIILTDYDSLLYRYPGWHEDVILLSLQAKLYVEPQWQVAKAFRQFENRLSQPEPNYQALARLSIQYAVSFYRHIELHHDSIHFFLKRAEGYLDKTDEVSLAYVQLKYQLSRLAYNRFDFEAQVNYSKEALRYQELHFPQNYNIRIHICNGTGIGFRNMGNAEEALRYFKLGLATPAMDRSGRDMHASIHNNLGLTYQDLARYEDCVREIEFAVGYYRDVISSSFPELGSGYDNLGNCYLKAGYTEKAVFYFKKAEEFIKHHLSPTDRDLMLPYLSFADLRQAEGKFDEALGYAIKAREIIKVNGWSREDPGGRYILEAPLDVLSSMMEIQMAMYNAGHREQLQMAWETMQDFTATTDYVFSQFDNTASMVNFFQRYEKVFVWGLECLYQLHTSDPDGGWTDRAIALIEKYKATEMRYAFQRAKVSFSERYRVLDDQYHMIMDSLRYLESLFYDEAEPSDEIREKLNLQRLALNEWKSSVRESHPEYHALIYQQEVPDIIRKGWIGDSRSVVWYKLGETFVYAIIQDDQNQYFIRTETDGNIEQHVLKLRKAISEYGLADKIDDKKARHLLFDYIREGSYLYEVFMASIASILKNELLIIPDGVLGYLPFSVLLTAKIGDTLAIKDYPFLLYQHDLAYSYSFALYKEMKDRRIHPGKNLLVVGPKYEVGDSLFSPLEFNLKECERIQELFRGDILRDGRASSAVFKAQCEDYRIIHLAAHGLANDEQGDRSFIVFSHNGSGNDFLYTSDIYNLNLEADLVSLSACQTATGELKKGEGIISLARAFSFAGARSVMSTLWQADDRATAQLATSFYREMKQGCTKSQALSRAMSAYIARSTQSGAHPYYWANFILIGDESAISVQQNDGLIYLLGFLLTLMLLMLLFRKKI